MTPKPKQSSVKIARPPVVVVMGHIDHGKSTLLDFIRKSNIVAGEAGGITQHLSAYQVVHKDEHGRDQAITFLDTPGHQAFSAMRSRGAKVADIAILVVSAEDGIKAQTLEALEAIKTARLPFVVAINKIDKPGTNIEKVKIDLAGHDVLLEGFGGNIPFAPISAKEGDGIDHLLELVLLVAEMEGFSSDDDLPAEGVVIESHLDPRRGISATLIIKNGILKRGQFVAVSNAYVGTRIFENFAGASIEEASSSMPAILTGWNELPAVGEICKIFDSKKEAEEFIKNNVSDVKNKSGNKMNEEKKWIPVIIKTDTTGVGDAIEKELKSLEGDTAGFYIILRGLGDISENDIKRGVADKGTIIIGFNVGGDAIREIALQAGILVKTFSIIYELVDFMKAELEKRRPRVEVTEVTGALKIIRIFSKTKERQVVGGRVTEGRLAQGAKVKIIRRDFEIGGGTIIGLEAGKVKTKEVSAENDCGVLIESKIEIATGDVLQTFSTHSD